MVATRGDGGVSVPAKYALNGTMPAVLNRSVGSPDGRRLAEGRTRCFLPLKKSIHSLRMRAAVHSPDAWDRAAGLALFFEDGRAEADFFPLFIAQPEVFLVSTGKGKFWNFLFARAGSFRTLEEMRLAVAFLFLSVSMNCAWMGQGSVSTFEGEASVPAG